MNEHAYKTDDLIDFSAINAIPVITVDSALSSTSTNPVQNKAIYTALAGKQSTLTFDSTPTSGSSNPVTSGGIYTAISNKMDKVTSVGSSSKPIYINSSGVPTACSYSIGTAASYGVTTSVTSGSSSLVTSGAVYNAINSASGDTWTIATPKPDGSLFFSLDASSSNTSSQKYTYYLSKDIRVVYRDTSGSSSAYTMMYWSFDLSKGSKFVSHKYHPIYLTFCDNGSSKIYFWYYPSNGSWGVHQANSYDTKDDSYINSNNASTTTGYYIMYK